MTVTLMMVGRSRVVTSGYELLVGVYGWLKMVLCGYEVLWGGCRWVLGSYVWL